MTEMATAAQDEEGLRRQLVDELVESGAITSRRVDAAFRAVPRHLFLPGTPLGRAYRDIAVTTKRDASGSSISSVSAPNVIAMMLELADIESGHRVLEIGSGGYNATLIRELVGPLGDVTSMDIDPDVIDRARRGLEAAGVTDIALVCADGEYGHPENGPYDRIIVTVGAWDIPPAWLDQLADGGRIVVPLQLRGLTRAIAFDRDGDRLTSRGHGLCGFVDMQGAGSQPAQRLALHDGQVQLWGEGPWPTDPTRLEEALTDAPVPTLWSGVHFGPTEAFADLDLWLVTVLTTGTISRDPDAEEHLHVIPAYGPGNPVLATTDTVAFRTPARQVPGTDDAYEFGASGFGPDAAALAAQIVAQIQLWDREQRGGAGPRVDLLPAGVPASSGDGLLLAKRHSQVQICWS